jgi:hypothetical protein
MRFVNVSNVGLFLFAYRLARVFKGRQRRRVQRDRVIEPSPDTSREDQIIISSLMKRPRNAEPRWNPGKNYSTVAGASLSDVGP